MTKKKIGRPSGSKNKKGLDDRRSMSFMMKPELLDYLDQKREEGLIKSRVIESALRMYMAADKLRKKTNQIENK